MDEKMKARGVLAGFILGDSLGIPTRGMGPGEVLLERGMITGLNDAPFRSPRYPAQPAGASTATAEQMLIVAGLLAEDLSVSPVEYAKAVLSSDVGGEESRDRESLDPYIRSMLERAVSGGSSSLPGPSSADAAAWTAPLAIVHSSHPDELSGAVGELCRAGGYTKQTVEAALLIAHTISAAIEGENVEDAVDSALAAVAGSEPGGRWTGEASAVTRTLQALDWADDLREVELLGYIQMMVGWSRAAGEAVPAALVLARAFAREPYRGLCAIAQLGGESSLIASLTGAILGASSGPSAFPQSALAQLENLDKAERVADRLAVLSGRASRVGQRYGY